VFDKKEITSNCVSVNMLYTYTELVAIKYFPKKKLCMILLMMSYGLEERLVKILGIAPLSFGVGRILACPESAPVTSNRFLRLLVTDTTY